MQSNPKKIILLHDTVFPFTKGGAQKRFYEIGKRLAQSGHDVHLYGMKSWQGPDVMSYEGMTFHKISQNYPLYTKSGRRSIYQAIMFGLSTFRLYNVNFDIIDCCGFPYFSIFPARILTWLRRKPLYSTWHEVWGYGYWKQYLGTLGIFGFTIERFAVSLPDKIISVSESTTQALENKLGQSKNVVTIPNGISLETIEKAKPSDQKSDVIFAGRLTAYKNVHILIKAIGILKNYLPDISLTIIGEGPEKKKLQEIATNLGIENNVRFMGFFQEEQTLYEYLKASKVFVLPSQREGFGIIVLEANACGLPVITVNHHHNAAKDLIVEGKNGMVVPLDEKSIAEAIKNVLENDRHTASCRKFASAYDWDSITKMCEEAFSEESSSV